MERLQLIVSIATVMMSGVVSGVVTFRLNANRDAKIVRRQKLEDVFKAFTHYSRRLGVYWHPYLAAMLGNIDLDAAIDMTSESSGDASDLDSMQMLVAIYFPEFQPHVDRLLGLRDRANGILGSYRTKYKKVGAHDASEGFTEMESVVNELALVELEFVRAVRIESSRLGGLL